MDQLGKSTPKLGFGLMRLPMIGDEVDIEQTKRMVDLFLEKGFTYFDTAYGYIQGKSEKAAKTAIVDRYPRDSFTLATKLPAWSNPTTADAAQNMFYTSLERTGAGYFDYYLLHNLGAGRIKYFDDFGIWDFVLEQKAKGLIKHLGFSMHDKADALDRIFTEHPEMEFVQLQINYADWESLTVESRKCYEVAMKHNKPVVIMEPVKGGMLATPPEGVANILRAASPTASLASWGIRFAASLDNVITVLSGMSTYEQVEDNVSYMEHFKPLDASERKVILEAQRALDEIYSIPCTSCEYCIKGCPQGIPIPRILSAMNTHLVFDNLRGAKNSYAFATANAAKASACIACGACEGVCPQSIGIIENLKQASGLFD